MATTLGPWPLGIDNVNPDTDLPEGALRVADDVLIDLNGTVNSGPGTRLLSALDGLSALWTSRTGASYAFLGESVARVDLAGVTPLANVGATNKGSFADHLDWVVTCSGGGLHRIRGDQVEPMALPYPAFTVRAGTAGGLDAGRYGVALATLRDGEEYALSPISFVNVAQGGGLVLNISDSSQVRIYRTGANGDQLYRAVDAPAGLPDYLIGAGLLGSLPSSQYLEPLPGGQLIASWNGRLLVARGRTLNFSQALRPALYDPRHDFLQLPTRLSMLAPVGDGVYLADRVSAWFANGTSPDQWVLRRLSAGAPPEGCFAVLPGRLFEEIPDVPVAVWLSETGFVLGLPEGQVVQPQAKRLRLTRPEHGSLTALGQRLFALAH
ncbi:TPA: hypothetical protein SL272_000824 [Pseudomonas aeruginosa]|nr:hypothetical protein [Pseudomonas aeruginosa]